MTQNEFDLIENIIKNETNALELLKVKKLLMKQMQQIGKIECKGLLSDEQFEICKNILLQDFRDFCDKNKPANVNSFSRNISSGARQILHMSDDTKLRVYHVLSIKTSDLKLKWGVGTKKLFLLEECLSRYGLSMEQKLTDIQLAELNAIAYEKANKKTLS